MTGAHMCLARDARNTLSFSAPITCPLKIKLACFLDMISLGLLTPHKVFFCQEPGKSPYHTGSPGGLPCSDTLRERISQMPVWGPWYTEQMVSPSLFFTELLSTVVEVSLKHFPKWYTVRAIKANSKGCSHSFVEGRKWGSNVSLSHSFVWTFYVQGHLSLQPFVPKAYWTPVDGSSLLYSLNWIWASSHMLSAVGGVLLSARFMKAGCSWLISGFCHPDQ